MATPLKDVYKIFLAEVESIKLAKLDEDIFYDTLFSYIEKTATEYIMIVYQFIA